MNSASSNTELSNQNNADASRDAVTPERTGGGNAVAFLEKLYAPFPEAQISWRAQSVTKDGEKAMALAYIDARDVMQRLDEVAGPAGWQCRYPHANGITICEIGIKVDGEWVWKANGAGNTDIEAEKGAASDAFKRAAVLWGIGRYLYDMPCPWVPCETYKKGDKHVWTAWKQSPWQFVKKPAAPDKKPEPEKKQEKKPMTPLERFSVAVGNINSAGTIEVLRKISESKNYDNLLSDLDGLEEKQILVDAVTERFKVLIPTPTQPQELQK